MNSRAMPSTLNLEDSNALLAVPEWGKLLRHFELGEGFALVVVLVPDTAVARMCQAELDPLAASPSASPAHARADRES